VRSYAAGRVPRDGSTRRGVRARSGARQAERAAHLGRDARPVQLDRPQHPGVGDDAGVLEQEAVVPKISCWNRILSTTSCGLPANRWWRGWRDRSKSARVCGGQPRSAPIRFITSDSGPKNSSAARCDVSAM
jgi:hypothetical protein